MRYFVSLTSIIFLLAATSQALSVESSPEQVASVSELILRVKDLANKVVTVNGEVDRKFGERSFVLEGGEVLNDKIIVLLDPKSALKLSDLTRDESVTVVGNVRRVNFVDIQRELGLVPDSESRRVMSDVRIFIVAQTVTPEAKRADKK